METVRSSTGTAVHALLAALIDYAGLFPPAGLSMHPAVENYARYKTGAHAWMLGRFVLPVSQLLDFEHAWHDVGSPTGWQLSALVANPAADLRLIADFNTRHAGAVKIDAIECKASKTEDIDRIALATTLETYVEVPLSPSLPALLAEIHEQGLRAKIRTGGVTEELFPSASAIAGFLRDCANAGLAFKATAGLHHPIRCVKPFTYEPNSPSGKMHGFLNVFLAAGLARKGLSAQELESLLLEEQPAGFEFTSEGVSWRDQHLDSGAIESARTDFAIAFGSCSFEEPIADLQHLGLLV
jgi:hypothetical protein